MSVLPSPIAFEWDRGNTDKNYKKHRVGNKEAEEIFEDKGLKILKDLKHSRKEERFFAYGITKRKRRLHIVFTIRDQLLRIISARDQSRKERKFYEKT